MKPVVATHADLADVKKYLADCNKTLKKVRGVSIAVDFGNVGICFGVHS